MHQLKASLSALTTIGGSRECLHPHILSTSIPVGQHKNLMRFRLGCADLASNNGRRSCAKNRVPRGDRVCTLPNCGGIEDELHAVFECKANAHIRLSSQYSGVYENVHFGDMRAFVLKIHSSLPWPVLSPRSPIIARIFS